MCPYCVQNVSIMCQKYVHTFVWVWTHFGIGHNLDTLWTHLWTLILDKCPKCVHTHIVQEHPRKDSTESIFAVWGSRGTYRKWYQRCDAAPIFTPANLQGGCLKYISIQGQGHLHWKPLSTRCSVPRPKHVLTDKMY